MACPRFATKDPFSEHPDVVKDLYGLLYGMRVSRQSLNEGIMQSIILGFFNARALEFFSMVLRLDTIGLVHLCANIWIVISTFYYSPWKIAK